MDVSFAYCKSAKLPPVVYHDSKNIIFLSQKDNKTNYPLMVLRGIFCMKYSLLSVGWGGAKAFSYFGDSSLSICK